MAMRVQCQVCGVEPATLLCCTDEAVLYSRCNRHVHLANKLAAKHRRLALIHPSPASNDTAPLCEGCEKWRGLVFCVEDWAILCGDYDVLMHCANEPTGKHSRFLLVGAKLSAEPKLDDCLVPDAGHGGGGGGGSSISISDYLTNICPGWHVEDIFLHDAAFAATKRKGREGDEQVPLLDISTSGGTTATSSSGWISRRRPPRPSRRRPGPGEPPSTTANRSRRRS